MARRKSKPKSPEQIALDKAKARAELKAADARLEFGIDSVALALPANDAVKVVPLPTDAKKVQTAWRTDVFDRLLNNDQLKAVRKLEADIAEQMGQSWRPGQRVTVDTSQFPPGQNINQAQIEAGKRVSAALAGTGARCGWLLQALIARLEVGFPALTDDEKDRAPTHAEREARGRSFDWRRVVHYVTGEANEHAQAARVRGAADNLASAYAGIEKAKAGARRLESA